MKMTMTASATKKHHNIFPNLLMNSSDIYYIYLQKKYSRRISLGLSRINLALKKLNNPHLKLNNPINIIGSDGKYSTLLSLKTFLEGAGNKTTSFISPHLYKLETRISLINKYISLNEFKKYEKIIGKLNVRLSLFEVLTLIYILAASKQKGVNYNLVEAGLLFKGDSTRLWENPFLQICTNINTQHLEWINPKNINEICKQKVGYLSNNTKIYIGKQSNKVQKIIENILIKNKSKITYSKNWIILNKKNKFYYIDNNYKLKIKSNYIKSEGLLNNLGLAIKIALDLGIKKSIIEKNIPKIKFEGRLQYLKSGKLKKLLRKNEKLLLDGSHSLASATNLYNYLKKIKTPIYGIWGMQKNKMPKDFLKKFKGLFKKIITVKIPNEKNALSSLTLKNIALKEGYKVETAKNIMQSIKILSSKESKTIVLFGSLYFVGSALKIN